MKTLLIAIIMFLFSGFYADPVMVDNVENEIVSFVDLPGNVWEWEKEKTETEYTEKETCLLIMYDRKTEDKTDDLIICVLRK